MPDRYLGVAPEVVYGTAIPPTRFMQLIGEDIHLEPAHEDVRVLSQHSPIDMPVISEHVEGSARVKGTYEDLGIFFEMILGGVDTSGIGPYTHTSPPATGIPFTRVGKMLTVEAHRDQATAMRWSGMKVTTLSMEFEQAKGPEFGIGFMGKDEVQIAPATPSYNDPINPMTALQLSLTVDAGSVSLFSASVNIDFPVDQIFLVGSKVLAKEPLENGGFAVTGTAEVCFDSLVEYALFTAGSAYQDIAIVATDTTLSLTLNMNRVRLTTFQPVLDERNRVRATFEWQATFDTTATDAIQSVLINNAAAA